MNWLCLLFSMRSFQLYPNKRAGNRPSFSSLAPAFLLLLLLPPLFLFSVTCSSWFYLLPSLFLLFYFPPLIVLVLEILGPFIVPLLENFMASFLNKISHKRSLAHPIHIVEQGQKLRRNIMYMFNVYNEIVLCTFKKKM